MARDGSAGLDGGLGKSGRLAELARQLGDPQQTMGGIPLGNVRLSSR